MRVVRHEPTATTSRRESRRESSSVAPCGVTPCEGGGRSATAGLRIVGARFQRAEHRDDRRRQGSGVLRRSSSLSAILGAGVTMDAGAHHGPSWSNICCRSGRETSRSRVVSGTDDLFRLGRDGSVHSHRATVMFSSAREDRVRSAAAAAAAHGASTSYPHSGRKGILSPDPAAPLASTAQGALYCPNLVAGPASATARCSRSSLWFGAASTGLAGRPGLYVSFQVVWCGTVRAPARSGSCCPSWSRPAAARSHHRGTGSATSR
jgi:hypothetical protein